MTRKMLALLLLPLAWACSEPAEPVRVGTVEVTAPVSSVVVGGTVQLSATVKDAAGNVLTDRLVTWTTNNSAVAVVNSSGLLMTASTGNVIVTASSEGVTGSTTITVNPPPVATVAIDPTTATLVVGQNRALTANVRDAAGNVLTGRTVTWSSNNTGVATVSASGQVSAVSAGTATITATSEGRSGTATITVTPAPVASITLTPSTQTSIAVGGTQAFSATMRDANGNVLVGRTVSWSSSNTAVASISAGGLALGLAPGTTIITGTSEGQAASVALVVTPPPVGSVEVTPATATLTINGTQQFNAVTRDASGAIITGRTVSWASSNTAVATVSGSGLVTGVGAGSATITASSEGRSGAATVTVNAANPTITLRNVVIAGTSTPVNFSNVSGSITATFDVSFPAGHQATAVAVQVGDREVCRTTIPAGTVGNLEVQCTINTAATEGTPAARIFPNGSYVLSGRVLNAANGILTVIGVAMTINNP